MQWFTECNYNVPEATAYQRLIAGSQLSCFSTTLLGYLSQSFSMCEMYMHMYINVDYLVQYPFDYTGQLFNQNLSMHFLSTDYQRLIAGSQLSCYSTTLLGYLSWSFSTEMCPAIFCHQDQNSAAILSLKRRFVCTSSRAS